MILEVTFLISLLIFYYTIWRPYSYHCFYQKQSNTYVEFVPIISTFSKGKYYTKQKNDYYWGVLEEKKKNPKLKVYGRNIGSTYMLYLLDPIYTQDLFTASDTQLQKHIFQNQFILSLAPKGLVLSQGQIWKKHRKLFGRAFSFKRIEKLLGGVIQSANQKINKLNQGQTISTMSYFKQVAGGILSQAFFDFDVNQTLIDGVPFPLYLSTLISDLSCQAYSYTYSLLGMVSVKSQLFSNQRYLQKRIEKVRKAVREIVRRETIKRKVQNLNEQDMNMWDIFLSNNEQFSQDQMIDQFITFFSDGVYTSGHFMMMFCYYIATNPKWQQIIREQITDQSLFAKQQSLAKLDKLRACIWETLRLAPPVVTGIERIVLEDMVLSKQYPLKKGTMVMACHVSNHFDPLLHDNPYTYDPNRWLTQSKTLESIKKYPGSFIPFSIGSRNCPGQHFAKAQGTIFLGKLIKKFNISLKDQNYNLKFAQKFLRQPQQSFEIVLTKYEKNQLIK